MNLAEDTRTIVPQPLPSAAMAAVALPNAAPAAEAAPAGSNAMRRRAEHVLVRTLPQLRYRVARVGPAGLTGLGMLAAAGVAALVLLLPAHRSVSALRGELARAGHPHPVPVAKANQTPEQFAAELPTRTQIPALVGVVLAQAQEAGVALDQGRYVFSPASAAHLARYTLEFPVKGEYGNIRRFIDRSLTAIPALGLDKLHIERKTIGESLVSAEVSFVIYLRDA